MSEIRSYRDLDAWRVATDAVELTYRLTADFPDAERFGLTSQMRRAAVSIPSNIAESHGVKKTRWSLRHIVTAIGSSCELDTQLEIALRLRFIGPAAARELQAALDRVQKLLYGMRRERERRLLGAAGGVGALLFVFLLRFLA
jgi:four helix bundle protein